VPNGIHGHGPSVRIEQYEWHTAWDRPGGVANRSGAGDPDVIIYTPRKWAAGLAENPTVLLALFVPDEEVVFRREARAELMANAHRFVSRLAATRFLGSLRAQQSAMTGQPGAHTNRPELVAVHGYDTKYAMHALQLGLQGIEFLTTGRITLPVPEPHRGYLRAVRRGDVPLVEVVEAITSCPVHAIEVPSDEAAAILSARARAIPPVGLRAQVARLARQAACRLSTPIPHTHRRHPTGLPRRSSAPAAKNFDPRSWRVTALAVAGLVAAGCGSSPTGRHARRP
jgi:hypothetical protein